MNKLCRPELLTVLATRPQEERKMYLNKLLDKWGKVDETEIVEEGESQSIC